MMDEGIMYKVFFHGRKGSVLGPKRGEANKNGRPNIHFKKKRQKDKKIYMSWACLSINIICRMAIDIYIGGMMNIVI